MEVIADWDVDRERGYVNLEDVERMVRLPKMVWIGEYVGEIQGIVCLEGLEGRERIL